MKGCLIAAAVAIGMMVLMAVLFFTVIGFGVRRAVKEIQKVTDKELVQVAVGEAARNGPLEVRVIGWTPSAGDEYNQPGEGKQFVVVDLEVKNVSGDPKTVSRMLSMSIWTPAGFNYDPAPYFPGPSYPEGPVQPGQTARGNVAFQVPADIGPMTFEFKPFLETGDIVRVKLQ